MINAESSFNSITIVGSDWRDTHVDNENRTFCFNERECFFEDNVSLFVLESIASYILQKYYSEEIDDKFIKAIFYGLFKTPKNSYDVLAPFNLFVEILKKASKHWPDNYITLIKILKIGYEYAFDNISERLSYLSESHIPWEPTYENEKHNLKLDKLYSVLQAEWFKVHDELRSLSNILEKYYISKLSNCVQKS